MAAPERAHSPVIFGSIAHGGSRLLEPGYIPLSELLTSLSTALDITEGQPPGHAVRTCLLGMRLAESLSLNSKVRAALFYALLLKDLGCSSNAAKMCWLFGADDRVVKREVKTVNWTQLVDRVRFVIGKVSPGGSAVQKALRVAAIARSGDEGARKLIETRCQRGAEISRLMGLPEATAEAIRSLDEHWNGKGHPDGLRGEEIPLLARILGLAQTAEVFFTRFGLARTCDVLQLRRGEWFEPDLVDRLLAIRGDIGFWEQMRGDDPQRALAAYVPDDEGFLADEAALDRVSLGFAQVVDAKSPWTHRHSVGVAEIAAGMAGILGCSNDMCRDIRRAGLLHDLGKLGVSNLILDKPGRPTEEEYAEIRRHPEFSERILRPISRFRRLAMVAGAHHERLDGNGYFRGLPAEHLSSQSRLLVVADVFEALSSKRPYRDEIPRERALAIMQRDCGKAFCPEAFAALKQWLDRNDFNSRVEAQLEQVDQLLAEL